MTKNINSIVEKFFTKYPASTLKPGETIIRAGTEIKTIYFLKKGSIRQFINSPEGERLIVQVFKPGSYVPIVLILSDTPCAYTFQALVPSVVHAAPAVDVMVFLKENPNVLFDLASRLSSAVVGLLKKVENMTFDTAYTRILSLLLHLAVKFGDQKGEEVTIMLPLTHSDIASMLGLRRETVTRRLALLQEKRLVRFDKEEIILTDFAMAKNELKNRDY